MAFEIAAFRWKTQQLGSSHVLALKLFHCDKLSTISGRAHQAVHTQGVELFRRRVHGFHNGKLIRIFGIRLISEVVDRYVKGRCCFSAHSKGK